MRQHNVNQQAPCVRRHSGSQRVQTWGTMTTEYQERFLTPRSYTAIITTSVHKNPYHPLKVTNADMPTFRSYYHKWMKNTPKPPKSAMPPEDHKRCSSTRHFVAHQMASKVEDYTTMYKNDFRAWKAKKLQPFRPMENLKVNQGLVATDSASKDGHSHKKSAQVGANSKLVPQVRELQPIESITSYRTDYVPHPVQPRTRREKPVNRTNKGLPLEPAVSTKPKMPWDINRELFDEASEFYKQFKTCSLETKFHGKAKKSSSPDMYLSTTHADYTSHQCQGTKPILPSMQIIEKCSEPLQAITTMKEDYRAWDAPRRLPIIPRGELECPKKPSFSLCTYRQVETSPKPFNPKLDESMSCIPTSNTTQKPEGCAENGALCGFECISTRTEESRRRWATSPDKGVTCADGDICEECPVR